MDAFVFNAALLCSDCGNRVRREIEAEDITAYLKDFPDAEIDANNPEDIALVLGFDPENENEYDSRDYPKGPYRDGGGKADTPQHCDKCGVFLKNPLTAEGYSYVVDEFFAYLSGSTHKKENVIQEWVNYYHSYGFNDQEIVAAFFDLIESKLAGPKNVPI